MTNPRHYDVLVAGGGLVGGSLAIALAQAGLQIALVESVPPGDPAQPSFDDRTLALARGSCQILAQLNVWSHIEASVWPIKQIHVSEQGSFGTALIDADEQGIAQLGYVIKAHALGAALWQEIAAAENINTYCPATVVGSRLHGNVREVELAGNAAQHSITTSLLVVADGARSALRAALGINAQERDYEQVAVVANVQIDQSQASHCAYERFTREGPLAILPGADGNYTMVLARKTATVDAILDMDDTELLAMLQSLFGYRLGRIRRIGRRQVYPLHLVTADAICAERAVIVGNAANGLHPVAAQGLNLGLRDIASLAELLADASRQPDFDAGGRGILDKYEAWRRDDQERVVAFTDGLIRAFGMPGEPAATMRGLSLAAFDVLPPVKRGLAKRTMGLTGRMSRLARGLPL